MIKFNTFGKLFRNTNNQKGVDGLSSKDDKISDDNILGMETPAGSFNISPPPYPRNSSEDSVLDESPHCQKKQYPSCFPIVLGKSGPVFEPKFIDEVFRSFPYRPDTILDGWSTEAFAIRAASIRGNQHRYEGSPRQDDFSIQLRHSDSLLAVAVADGVSAANQSHIGAAVAVRYATQWIAQKADLSKHELLDWKELLSSTAWAIVDHASNLLGLVASDPADKAEETMATTLVCGAIVPMANNGGLRAILTAVGDSGAWVLNNSGYRVIVASKEANEHGIISSAVSALPRVPGEPKVIEVILEPGDVLLLGTDGFGDPLGSGKGELGDTFKSLLYNDLPSLAEFIHYLDFSKDTFDDDRTLVAIWAKPA